MKKFLFFFTFLALPMFAHAGFTRDIEFPVQGESYFNDNFNDPRSGGRLHEAVDIITEKHTPLVAAVDGVISSINIPEKDWGYALTIRDSDGYTYHYLHINNDTPGTDDGNGGLVYAYAPGISRGVRVSRGQLIAYAGDSGNSESVGAHLHFEIRTPDDRVAINPYESLVIAAEKKNGTDYEPAARRDATPSINEDKNLEMRSDGLCTSGSLIKVESLSAVYYCGADGKRYVFPNDKTYFTWYEDFSNVEIISESILASIPIGGNVTYRPGVRMVKITTDPKVYAVDRGGMLRWVSSSAVAEELYGTDWADNVHDISDAFFVNYTIGEPIGGNITVY